MTTAPVDVAADLRAIYDTIIARMTGKQVQSAGHKDRSAAYAQTDTKDLIKIYRMLWTKDSGLPDLKDLDASVATRGTFRIRLHG
jgi:hypothetical protein